MSMNYTIPKDPNMLLSYVNMMLRDRYSSLEEFCAANDGNAAAAQMATATTEILPTKPRQSM